MAINDGLVRKWGLILKNISIPPIYLKIDEYAFMETPDINELNNSIHIKNEEFCKTKYPEFTGFLENKYPNITHIERLYMYIIIQKKW